MALQASTIRRQRARSTLTSGKSISKEGRQFSYAAGLNSTSLQYYVEAGATRRARTEECACIQLIGLCRSMTACNGPREALAPLSRKRNDPGCSLNVLICTCSWGSTISAGGFMSDDCTVNPEICNFNRVYMPYCDGRYAMSHP